MQEVSSGDSLKYVREGLTVGYGGWEGTEI